MSDRFRALLITKEGDKQIVTETGLTVDDLMEGDVTIAVSHSTVNYKDGLALTGRSPVVRRFPMIPGVDLAGVVTHSASPAFHEGERVLVNGFGLGETHYGAMRDMRG
jgi:acrylyl-CoA reductase (NADPH)